jgi:hypothetical protein
MKIEVRYFIASTKFQKFPITKYKSGHTFYLSPIFLARSRALKLFCLLFLLKQTIYLTVRR